MKWCLENCRYELVKDLLMSADSLIEDVKKDGNTTIVTLKDDSCKDDFMTLISRDPLNRLCLSSRVHVQH